MFQIARGPGGGTPAIRWMTYTGTVYRGSVLVYSSNAVAEAGADPTEVVGVALQASDSGPGFNQANAPTVNTYRAAKMSVAIADRLTVFRGKMTNGSSVRVSPATTDIGVEYGITAYSNVWTVDRNKTSTDKRVQVIGFDDLTGDVFFKWLEAAITPNP